MVPDFVRRLEEEKKKLEYELKNELPKEIQTARELGDLSENAEYAAAKERQSLVSAQLGRLTKRLAELRMIDFSKIRTDAIGLGSSVRVYDMGADKEIEYVLVASEEADVPNGKISTTAPIGRALISKQEGDVIEVDTPGGRKELEVISYTTIHERFKG